MRGKDSRSDRGGRKRAAAVLLLTAVVCLPFLNKPFHIDDTVVLHVTSRILLHPLDPFSGGLNWNDREIPIWEATTNPPLLSYVLAPLAAISDYSEVVLHGGMMFFYALLAVSVWSLARRFCGHPGWGLLFFFLSPAVMVSGNVMRDIPAVALGTAALALFVSGVDDGNRARLFWGGILAGLAILTKYSMAVFPALMVLYALLQQRFRRALWVGPAAVLVGIWCLHNQLMYGQVHILFLLLKRSYVVEISLWDKLLSALVVLGSAVFLPPLLLRIRFRRGLRAGGLPGLACAAGGAAAAWATVGGRIDGQFIFWAASGGFLLGFSLSQAVSAVRKRPDGPRDSGAADGWFLLAWLSGPLVFSVLFTPFQAVRHLIAVLPPLIFLCLRGMGSGPLSRPFSRWAAALLAVQAVVGFAVHLADYEFASVYRKFAGEMTREQPAFKETTWYAGHWGWQFYAERAGFQALAADRPFPRAGDRLILVDTTLSGSVLRGKRPWLKRHGRLIRVRSFRAVVPVRTVRFPDTGFYSIVQRDGPRVPYRFGAGGVLETFSIFRIEDGPSRIPLPGD